MLPFDPLISQASWFFLPGDTSDASIVATRPLSSRARIETVSSACAGSLDGRRQPCHETPQGSPFAGAMEVTTASRSWRRVGVRDV